MQLSNVISPIELLNQLIPNPRNHQDLQLWEEELIRFYLQGDSCWGYRGCNTLWLAVMDSDPTLIATSLMHFLQLNSGINQFQTQVLKKFCKFGRNDWFWFYLQGDWFWGCSCFNTVWLAGCHEFNPYFECHFSIATMKSINSKPKKSTRSASLGGGADILILFARRLILCMYELQHLVACWLQWI